MAHEYCELGITVRALRWAFRDELKRNRRMVGFVAKAAGLNALAEIGEIALKAHEGLVIACVTRSGIPIRVPLEIHIDKNVGKPTFIGAGSSPKVRRQTTGCYRPVTIAPYEWFTLKDNAQSALNMLPLERFKAMGSDEFREAVDEALHRAACTYRELRRPKVELPGWVKRRLYINRA